MLLQINDIMHVSDLQEKFNESFPYLKIEFYTLKNGKKNDINIKEFIDPGTLFRDIIKKQKTDLLEIKSWYKNSMVNQAFKKNFGLNVQIFHLQGREWIQAGNINDQSLQEQNDSAQKLNIENKAMLQYDDEFEI